MASNTVSILQFFNDDLQLRGAAIREQMTRLDVGCKTGNLKIAFQALQDLNKESALLQSETVNYHNIAIAGLQREIQENATLQYQQAQAAMDMATKTLQQFVSY